MKKIFVLIGSRRKEGNTANFIRRITDKFECESFEIEYVFPQDYDITACDGDNKCFIDLNHNSNDELKKLQKKILDSDIFIVGSPVYVHSMTSDLKLFIERSAWWAHTLRLGGKPVVVISTCGSNGLKTVTEPLSEIMTFMGANVIANANAVQALGHFDDEVWLKEVTETIIERIKKYVQLPPMSNRFLEQVFTGSKLNILEQLKVQEELGIELGELEYWKKSGMINFDSFEDYLINSHESS
ncbi:flavodoxin family protein [Enterococcus casseliflavus]|uniref:flavodoxin family protein n=1 Tax=Enterococcus casseliflavus TaxID=37734 RepID=UPI0034D3152F